MHISDGILPTTLCLAAHAGAGAVAFLASRRMPPVEIPRIGLMAAAVFTTSLIHFPLGGTSVHLGLFGLAGALLGMRSFLVLYSALLLQALLFQHGGLLTLGVNALNMGSGAMLGHLCWRYAPGSDGVRGFAAGFSAAALPAMLMAFEFFAAGYGKGFFVIASVYSLVAALEGVVTAGVLSFLRRTSPRLLERPA